MALSAEPPGVAAMAPESGTPAPQRQLRRLLIFGLVCSNLLVCALCAYALFHDRQQYESRAEMLTQNVASAVDQNVSSSIDRVDLALRAVGAEVVQQALEEVAARDAVAEAPGEVHLQRLGHAQGWPECIEEPPAR